MMPTPTPAPPMPIHAIPAPIYFAAVGSMRTLLLWFVMAWPSVAGVNCIIKIDASKNSEHISLQERHQKLECGQQHDHDQWQCRAEEAEYAGAAQHNDKAGKHLQRDMARQHVGKQTDAVRDRSRQKRQYLDGHDCRQNEFWHALRHEQIEEVQTVFPEAVADDDEEHEQR